MYTRWLARMAIQAWIAIQAIHAYDSQIQISNYI